MIIKSLATWWVPLVRNNGVVLGVIHNEMSGVTNRQHSQETKMLNDFRKGSSHSWMSHNESGGTLICKMVARKLSHVLPGTHCVILHFLLLAVNGGAFPNPAH